MVTIRDTVWIPATEGWGNGGNSGPITCFFSGSLLSSAEDTSSEVMSAARMQGVLSKRLFACHGTLFTNT